MDSGRFLLAVILMIAVMVITNILLPPPPAPQPQQPDTTVAAPGVPPPQPDATVAGDTLGADTLGVAPQPIAQTPQQTTPAAPADTISVTSPIYEYAVSTRGAAIVGARLLQFSSLQEERADQPVQLAPSGELGPLFGYRIRVGTREIDLSQLPFEPSAPSLVLAEGDPPRQLELTHTGANGFGVIVAYTFDPDRYTVDARIAIRGADATPNLIVGLPSTLAMNEAVPVEDERALAYVVNSEQEGISSVRLDKVDAERVASGPLLWAAVKNKYFVVAALGDPQTNSRFGGLVARPVEERFAARMEATLQPAPDGTFSLRYYIGPQEPQRLAELGNQFQDVNPFGWRAFRPILRPLGHAIQWALYGLHELFGIGYGWVLILFGVLIRVALWPLNAKAMRSQMKNMEIQPRLKEIQTKYKNHPEQLQKEMIKLYKEEGFNPMGGCLPMLIPLPILITLFFVFQSTIAFRGVEFLWLPDLSQKDPLYVLPVLLGASMFLMQWLSTRTMTEQNPQMKFMMYAMPIMMTVLFLNFASGLNLYYTAMNFASLPQQLQLTRERKRYQAQRAAAVAKA